MKAKSRQSGLTLMEMTVVIAVVALLVSLGLPAVHMLFDSFESQGGGRAVISAALASARAIAAREQRYAGVRFQQDLDGNQYMVFIVHDPARKPYGTNLTNGFRAVEGVEPIKLPGSVGVMDLRYRANLLPAGDGLIDSDIEIGSPEVVTDTTSFSIVFSPSGKMVIHNVRVRNRDGIPDSAGELGNPSADDIFNKRDEVDAGIGMFYQDDYAAQDSRLRYYPENLGLGEESSRNKFIIYDKTQFDKLDGGGRFNYLSGLEFIYINPYTGTMIKK